MVDKGHWVLFSSRLLRHATLAINVWDSRRPSGVTTLHKTLRVDILLEVTEHLRMAQRL